MYPDTDMVPRDTKSQTWTTSSVLVCNVSQLRNDRANVVFDTVGTLVGYGRFFMANATIWVTGCGMRVSSHLYMDNS